MTSNAGEPNASLNNGAWGESQDGLRRVLPARARQLTSQAYRKGIRDTQSLRKGACQNQAPFFYPDPANSPPSKFTPDGARRVAPARGGFSA